MMTVSTEQGQRVVTLERMKFVVLQYITEELADLFAYAPAVSISPLSFLADEIVLRVTQEVYGRTMEEVSAEWPADWWQAVKDRWAPGWMKARWPVKMKCVRLQAKELYPKFSRVDWEPQLHLARRESVRWQGQPEGSADGRLA